MDISGFFGYREKKRAYWLLMTTITIRDFPDAAKETLRAQAEKAGVSLENFARELLLAAAREEKLLPAPNLLLLSRQFFGEWEGVDLELPSRLSGRQGVELDSWSSSTPMSFPR